MGGWAMALSAFLGSIIVSQSYRVVDNVGVKSPATLEEPQSFISFYQHPLKPVDVQAVATTNQLQPFRQANFKPIFENALPTKKLDYAPDFSQQLINYGQPIQGYDTGNHAYNYYSVEDGGKVEARVEDNVKGLSLSDGIAYSKPVRYAVDDEDFEHSGEGYTYGENVGVYGDKSESKKKGEIHYHQHKHLHEHDHKQDHVHKHNAGHQHEHSHGHSHKSSHKHQHAGKHEHAHKSEHQHEHQDHHQHDHKGVHAHEHKSAHKHGHSHGHKHEHHSGHKHEHKHEAEHAHDHHEQGKHSHHHDHKHKGHHNHDHQADHKHSHKHKHSNHHSHGHHAQHDHHHTESGKHHKYYIKHHKYY